MQARSCSERGVAWARAGALTSAVWVWSSLSPGHWTTACRLRELPRALSSACSASKSFWCSEQAARCSHSSCLRDSAEGRAAGGQAHRRLKSVPQGQRSRGGGGEVAAEGFGLSSPKSFQGNSNNSTFRTPSVLNP